ncbi:hypothetical protein B0I35DRAFT_477013 [Stachybotrys elegans]|uniref:Stress-response A/B barrel domain-containing protein n=1 Tax=Stachybotrys elegans TaxID=80388 RepID=A0A8K0T0M7_9HYPO|nr:hypothetical protein B0I35DRAFT_477013 [Stachybotrys elegans]
MIGKRPATILVFLCVFVLLLINFIQPRSVFTLTTSPTMSVTHTVLFQFKAGAEPAEVKAACDRFLALKDSCLHPTSKSPYIASLKGGQDNSPEGLQNGITHGFVAEFKSLEDRDYYVKNDPAHQAFIKSIGGLVDKAIVVDFTNGVY